MDTTTRFKQPPDFNLSLDLRQPAFTETPKVRPSLKRQLGRQLLYTGTPAVHSTSVLRARLPSLETKSEATPPLLQLERHAERRKQVRSKGTCSWPPIFISILFYMAPLRPAGHSTQSEVHKNSPLTKASRPNQDTSGKTHHFAPNPDLPD